MVVNEAFEKYQVATIRKDNNEPNDDHWIHPCLPRYVLKNWTYTKRTECLVDFKVIPETYFVI